MKSTENKLNETKSTNSIRSIFIYIIRNYHRYVVSLEVTLYYLALLKRRTENGTKRKIVYVVIFRGGWLFAKSMTYGQVNQKLQREREDILQIQVSYTSYKFICTVF